PDTVWPDDTVRLFYHPLGTTGDSDQQLPLAGFNFSADASELQLQLGAPLDRGSYQLFLAGDSELNFAPLTDLDGVRLGTDAAHPAGQDVTITFQVSGIEGETGPEAGADDTPVGAHDLGDLTQAGLVQRLGAIGDDPTDPVPFDPADVDLYHFRVNGAGR